jgi:hypothetical protein
VYRLYALQIISSLSCKLRQRRRAMKMNRKEGDPKIFSACKPPLPANSSPKCNISIKRKWLHDGEQLPAPGHSGAGDDRNVFGDGHSAWDRGHDCVATGPEAAYRRAYKLAMLARQLTPGTALWELMVGHLRRCLSPAQIECTLARMPDLVNSPIALSARPCSLFPVNCFHADSTLFRSPCRD